MYDNINIVRTLLDNKANHIMLMDNISNEFTPPLKVSNQTILLVLLTVEPNQLLK